MKFSNFFIPTLRENPSEAKIKSHSLMIKAGMIKQETSGIYTWLPLGYKVLKKIINIIEIQHEIFGVNQILMPTIQSADIWKISERYNSYGKEMLRIKDRHSKELLYGPTNEEMITAIGKKFIKSYKNLPRFFYHIQTKFRDEIRPRFGVMRAREFLMKDAYSFDIDEKQGEKTYQKFYKLYLNIFNKLGIKVLPVRALSGEIGGSLSHEFHVLVESGESEIYINESILNLDFEDLDLNEIMNLETYTDDYYDQIGSPSGLVKYKSIELGHIFLFGTKYSDSFDFDVDSESGKFKPYMGSYGIGISRIPAAIIELLADDEGIIWPDEVVPFNAGIINLILNNRETVDFCEKLYGKLSNLKIDVLYDDRDERPGIKFADIDLIGIPIQIIVGKNFLNEKKISIKLRNENKEYIISPDECIEFVKKKIRKV